MTDEQFKTEMCTHMKAQTDFLSKISDAMHTLRDAMQTLQVIGRIFKWIVWAVSSGAAFVGLWTFLTAKH